VKFFVNVAVAVVAVTLVSGGAASAAPSGTSLVQRDEPGKSDPPGVAKGQDQRTDHPTPAATGKPTTSPKPKPKPAVTTPAPTATATATKPNPGKAVGRTKTGTGTPTPRAGDGNSPSSASGNENTTITFCHVPPGNPAQGHVITTSVNAISPGHVNHPGDIIPPFSYLKQGRTVSFAGQNWDAAGQQALANGCTSVASAARGSSTTSDASTGSSAPAVPAAPAAPAVPSSGPTPGTSLTTGDPQTGISTTSLSADAPTKDESVIEGLLPNTGGARLGLLVAGVALVAGGTALVARRRRVA